MENFSQEEVDRMIQEAAMAAKQKRPTGVDLNTMKKPQPAEQNISSAAMAQKPVINQAQQEPKPSATIPNVQEPPVTDQMITEQDDVFEQNDTAGEIQDVFEQDNSIDESFDNTEFEQNDPVEDNFDSEIPDDGFAEPQSQNVSADPVVSRTTVANPVQSSSQINNDGLRSFLLEVIDELAQAKVQLAQVKIELEMEKLRSQAIGFFK